MRRGIAETVVKAFIEGRQHKGKASGGRQYTPNVVSGANMGGQRSIISVKPEPIGVRSSVLELRSYDTTLAVRCEGCVHEGVLLANATRYSKTTNDKLWTLEHAAKAAKLPLLFVYGDPAGKTGEFGPTDDKMTRTGLVNEELLHWHFLAIPPLERAVLLSQARKEGIAYVPITLPRAYGTAIEALRGWTAANQLEWWTAANTPSIEDELDECNENAQRLLGVRGGFEWYDPNVG